MAHSAWALRGARAQLLWRALTFGSEMRIAAQGALKGGADAMEVAEYRHVILALVAAAFEGVTLVVTAEASVVAFVAAAEASEVPIVAAFVAAFVAASQVPAAAARMRGGVVESSFAGPSQSHPGTARGHLSGALLLMTGLVWHRPLPRRRRRKGTQRRHKGTETHLQVHGASCLIDHFFRHWCEMYRERERDVGDDQCAALARARLVDPSIES